MGERVNRLGACAAHHELALLIGSNETRKPEFFQVKRNSGAELFFTGDMAADLTNGDPLDGVYRAVFFHRHGATPRTKELEDRPARGVAQRSEHRGQVKFAHSLDLTTILLYL